MVMWATLLPHQKKSSELKPTSILPLPWDEDEDAQVDFKPADQETVKNSIEYWKQIDEKKNREIEQ